MTRTHFLEQTDISGREAVLELLPAFDFYKLGRVIEVSLRESSAGDGLYHLTIVARYEDHRALHAIRLSFFGARLIRLPEMTPTFYFGELEVEDLSSDQLEGIRVRVKDYGTTTFEVACDSIGVEMR